VSTYGLSFTLTTAGIDAAFNAGAVDLAVTHVQIGSGNRTPNGSETALVSPQEYAAISGYFEVSVGQHRISTLIPGSASTYNISEIGLWSGIPGDVGSVLVFYWALGTGHVAVKSASVDFNFENDMFFGGVVPANITIVADTQFTSLAMIAEHEAKPNAHPKGVQRFTVNGSFTVPTAVTKIYVSGCAGGGGGGGGGRRTSTAEFGGGGGGGGAGQNVFRQEFSVTPGDVIAITIGGSGSGGTTAVGANGNAGTSGGNTVVGSLITFTGGAGGSGGGGATGFAGGGGGTGYPQGSYGTDGSLGTGGAAQGSGNGGAGASCPFGGGGGCVRSTSSGSAGGISGYNAAGYGSGGAGGSTGTGGTGGNGAPGIVIIEW
jgi:hypothetical protein